MLFPTLDFALFFLVVSAALACLGNNFTARKWVLVVASYIFYAQWNWHFCVLLFWSSALSYAAGLLLGRAGKPGTRRLIVAACVAAHLVVLAFFKYFDFIVGSLNGVARAAGLGEPVPFVEILLPLGISFFTFHGISYVVDVYRGDSQVCRRPQDMLLYMAFFPQLVAGPILRSSKFLPQLAAPSTAPIIVEPWLVLILGGLFKKVILANYLGTDLVDPVFRAPLDYGTIDLVLAVYGYAVQIYCDFSAYTDIAIGLAGLLGLSFPQNFNQPYRATSLADFWRRWHITLSSWLRDYLYKPLGGNRRGAWRTRANLMITMLLGGLWHGAAWHFVLWGGLHGLGLVVARVVRMPRWWAGSRIGRGLAILLTFHFVCLAWLFFRADDLEAVSLYLQSIWAMQGGIAGVTPFTLGLLVLGLGLHAVPGGLPQRIGDILANARSGRPRWVGGAAFAMAVLAIDALGPDGVAPFIYFQF